MWLAACCAARDDSERRCCAHSGSPRVADEQRRVLPESVLPSSLGQEQKGLTDPRLDVAKVVSASTLKISVLVGPSLATLAAIGFASSPLAVSGAEQQAEAAGFASWRLSIVAAAAAVLTCSLCLVRRLCFPSGSSGNNDTTIAAVVRSKSADGRWAAPLETHELDEQQGALLAAVRTAIQGKTWATLERNTKACHWLRPIGADADKADEVVCFTDRDLVRAVFSIGNGGTNGQDPVKYGSAMLQQAYAFRHDHGMDSLRMQLDLTSDDLRKCREVYPKAASGLAAPHGYPILWDMPFSLRARLLEERFGSLDRGLEKLLWYDLHIMERYERYKKHLSTTRGELMLKGVQVFDFGTFSTEVLHPAIVRTVLQIIVRSGQLWPESVWRLYLVGVPLLFLPFWSVIKRAAHPVTIAKVHMFTNRQDFFKHCEAELGISVDDVPVECGGRGPSLQRMPIVPAHGDYNGDNMER
mmetsp:Transcript_56720/g.164514  ORF Transcript_56720/g.164514 Transcript_56720/m.164514 type:complete len:470 (-) Transcript_56720:181-1590(-)